MTVSTQDSILTSTKLALNIAADDTNFDVVILMHINSVFSDLQQIGVGLTDDQFEVADENATWADALTTQKNLASIKSYMNMRLRLLFDPPAAGFTTDSFQRQIDKMEWRIKVAASSTPNPMDD